jgi:hypothetical protein
MVNWNVEAEHQVRKQSHSKSTVILRTLQHVRNCSTESPFPSHNAFLAALGSQRYCLLVAMTQLSDPTPNYTPHHKCCEYKTDIPAPSARLQTMSEVRH